MSQLTVRLALCSRAISQSSVGMLPVRFGFPYSKIVFKVDPSDPSSVGMVPASLSLNMYNVWRLVNRPSSVGIGPVTLGRRDSLVSRGERLAKELKRQGLARTRDVRVIKDSQVFERCGQSQFGRHRSHERIVSRRKKLQGR
jgi:hypothetical protein